MASILKWEKIKMADKLDMKSMDITQENISKIQALFPSAVTEVMGEDGKVKLAIDFDVLKQELSAVVVEGKEERYQFTWPDKKKSILAANAPISDTLRPCREESVDFDNTENLYIEGDISKDAYEKRRDEIRTELGKLESDRSELDYEKLNAILNSGWRTMYDLIGPEDKAHFWRTILHHIEIKTDGTFRPWFNG